MSKDYSSYLLARNPPPFFDFFYLYFQHFSLLCLVSSLIPSCLLHFTGTNTALWVLGGNMVFSFFFSPPASLFYPEGTEQTSMGYFHDASIFRRLGDELFVSALKRFGASFCHFRFIFL